MQKKNNPKLSNFLAALITSYDDVVLDGRLVVVLRRRELAVEKYKTAAAPKGAPAVKNLFVFPT
jgi:hypothetical protein